MGPYDNASAVYFPNGDVLLENNEENTRKAVNYLLNNDYIIQDGDTLQSIAYSIYGDSSFWWVIADINNILNPFEELVVGGILTI